MLSSDSQALTKAQKVRKSSEFKKIFKGIKVVRPNLIFYAARRSGPSRLGLVVSKKVGNACTRNRVKRLLREIFRVLDPNLSLDLVVIARWQTAAQSHKELQKSFYSAVQTLDRKAGDRPPAENT